MNKKGQSLLEYSVLIIIICGVFIAMQQYVKRGIQGRWKSSADSMGEQYDPRVANTLINYSTNSSANTVIDLMSDSNGTWTRRTDSSHSIEAKASEGSVGSISDGTITVWNPSKK